MSSHSLLGARNLLNATVLLAVLIPSVLFSVWLFGAFEPGAIPSDPGWTGVDSPESLAAWLLHHPVGCVNLLFFVNVCVIFWLIALVQRSTWLIDPYWTLLPVLIALFYLLHPLATPTPIRSWLCLALLCVWSLRLTHNYFRREQWRFGFREDWRFAKMRGETRHFWWIQFFYVYAAQQVMLVGLTLPFWAIGFRARAFGAWDVGLCVLALLGLAIANAADTRLDAFVRDNEARQARGDARRALLEEGIWRYSRHPNYFGEQLFWWAIAGYGVLLGEPWVVAGTAINSCVLAAVTVMTERRMLDSPGRREVYQAYQRRTSVWLPLPPRAA